MDGVVDTQLELYNTSWLQRLVYILCTSSLIFKYHSVCRDGSPVHGIKATWSAGKLSDSHMTAVYMSTTELEEGIVGVDRTSNQAVIQQFSRTSPG